MDTLPQPVCTELRAANTLPNQTIQSYTLQVSSTQLRLYCMSCRRSSSRPPNNKPSTPLMAALLGISCVYPTNITPLLATLPSNQHRSSPRYHRQSPSYRCISADISLVIPLLFYESPLPFPSPPRISLVKPPSRPTHPSPTHPFNRKTPDSNPASKAQMPRLRGKTLPRHASTSPYQSIISSSRKEARIIDPLRAAPA